MKPLIALLLISFTAQVYATEKLFYDKMAATAQVVVRAKFVSFEGADKYAFYQVRVQKIFKNNTKEMLTPTLSVASYSWKKGIPKGESTLYLEKYNESNKGYWKLIGGEASTGVSHASKQ